MLKRFFLLSLFAVFWFAMPSHSDVTYCEWPNCGGGGTATATGVTDWDVEIDISTASTACADFASGVADYMDGTTNVGRVRVHHDGVQSVAMDVMDDFYDGDDIDGSAGPWAYLSCFMLHPTTGQTGDFPDSLGTVARTSLGNNTFLYILFDNINIEIDQTGLDENAVLLDFGNGWNGGQNGSNSIYGALSQSVKIDGNVFVNITTKSEVGVDVRVPPSPTSQATNDGTSNDARFNATYDDAFVSVALNRATYVNFKDLTVYVKSQDKSDIMGHFVHSWGSVYPSVRTMGTGDGVGVQYVGAQNAHQYDNHIHIDTGYGVVMGSHLNRGESPFANPCAGESCTAISEQGVSGLRWTGGTVEGQSNSLLLAWDYNNNTVFRDVHWECGARCDMAGLIISPEACDGTTGDGPVPAGVPELDDEAWNCVDGTIDVDVVTDNGATATVDTVAAHGLIVGEEVIFRNTGITALDNKVHTVTVEDDSDTFTISTDPADTCTSCPGTAADVTSDGGEADPLPGTPAIRGAITFAGYITPTGDSDLTYNISPAFMIGSDFRQGQILYFTDGVTMGNANDTSFGLFTFHKELTQEYAGSIGDYGDPVTPRPGRVDTSGATFRDTQTVFPGTYASWTDSREKTFGWIQFQDPWGGAGTDWSNGTLPAGGNCINWRTFPFQDGNDGHSCTSTDVLMKNFGSDVYITRVDVQPTARFDGLESCEFAFQRAASDTNTGNVGQIPPAEFDGLGPGDYFREHETWKYNIGAYFERQDDGVQLNSVVWRFGDGDYSHDGGAGSCDGTFSASIQAYYWAFDPFE